jgi:hypothetical protein
MSRISRQLKTPTYGISWTKKEFFYRNSKLKNFKVRLRLKGKDIPARIVLSESGKGGDGSGNLNVPDTVKSPNIVMGP